MKKNKINKKKFVKLTKKSKPPVKEVTEKVVTEEGEEMAVKTAKGVKTYSQRNSDSLWHQLIF